VREVETALERELSRQIMSAGEHPQIRRMPQGDLLTREGEPGDDLFLLLDGVLEVEVAGRVIAEVGPGAVLGERALLEGGRRTSTLRAVTPCTVAVAGAGVVDRDALADLVGGHRREDER
jgi:CRP-like cAMP-binding protein